MGGWGEMRSDGGAEGAPVHLHAESEVARSVMGPLRIQLRNLRYAPVMARKWCERGGGWWMRSCVGHGMSAHEDGTWYVEGVECFEKERPSDLEGAMRAAEDALRKHFESGLAELSKPVGRGRVARFR